MNSNLSPRRLPTTLHEGDLTSPLDIRKRTCGGVEYKPCHRKAEFMNRHTVESLDGSV